MRLFTLIEHGKILRHDYRRFGFNTYLSIDDISKHGAKTELTQRIQKYFDNREVEFRYEEAENMGWIEFEKLDDAQMFVLSFSDVIKTNGVRFE